MKFLGIFILFIYLFIYLFIFGLKLRPNIKRHNDSPTPLF